MEDMLADGFTKALPRPKHEKFVKQLELKDIRLKLENTNRRN